MNKTYYFVFVDPEDSEGLVRFDSCQAHDLEVAKLAWVEWIHERNHVERTRFVLLSITEAVA